jgi:copper homeostasis protein
MAEVAEKKSYKVEIIAFTIEACSVIEQAGANRIELCANPTEGGTTPSYGMIKSAREAVGISLFPIIRPRGGDFLYTDAEYRLIEDDVKLCKQLGCDGVVLGLLQKDGSIDVKRTARLVELAYPMEVTFHRAFDHCRDPLEALEQLIKIGCQRILTSGQKPLATEGADLLAELVEKAADRIIIMPGSGVRPDNIAALAQKTGAVEFHASLRTQVPSAMDYLQPAFYRHKEVYAQTTTDAAAIRLLIHQLNNQ